MIEITLYKTYGKIIFDENMIVNTINKIINYSCKNITIKKTKIENYFSDYLIIITLKEVDLKIIDKITTELKNKIPTHFGINNFVIIIKNHRDEE
jgi:RNA binding exosome subunit